MSECDHQYETRNTDPEIGTDGSSHTRRNPRVDGYGSGFGPPIVSGSGFWTVLEPNRPIFAVQTRTAGGLFRPVANTNPMHQSTDDWVPGHKYSIPGLPGTKFLVHQVWAIWFILRMWDWDTDMPGALVADEMGLGKTFTSVAAAMLCKLVTEKVVLGLPLSILWGNTLEVLVILAHNDFHGIVGEERQRYPLQRLNSVPRCLLEIQTTSPHGHPALVSALEPILVVTMHRVGETFKTVIDDKTQGTEFKLVNLLHAENANLTHEDLNTSIDEPEI